MSFFKKIKNMLVEPVDPNDPDEGIVIASDDDDFEPYVASTKIDEETITPRAITPRPRATVLAEPEVKEDKKPSSFVDISADDEFASKAKPKQTQRVREPKRESRDNKEQRESTRDEEFGLRDDPYETSDVISPLYGRVDTGEAEDDKPVVRQVKSSKVSSVISPMYGRVESSKTEEAKEEKVVTPQPVEAKPIQDVFAVVDMEEEEDGIDLGSMLSKDSEEALDETTQISLFGDHVAVTKQEQDMLGLDEQDEESYTQLIQKPEDGEEE